MRKRLTAVAIAALKPGAKAYYVGDDVQSGLRIRVAPSGALSWNVAYRVKGGSPKTTSLGPCDPDGRSGLGLAEARERAADILKAARQGRDLLAEEAATRAAASARMSVDDLITRYAKSVRSPHRRGGPLRTSDDIERRLRRALSANLTSPAEDISRADISGLLDEVAERTPREAEKRRQTIGAMFRWGVTKGFVGHDPTAGTASYGVGALRDRVLDPDEIRTLWQWFGDGAGGMPVDVVAALKVQLGIGARVGEVAGMEALELRLENDRLLWTLPPARSKNKAARVTPLVGLARQIVEEQLCRHKKGPLFRTLEGRRALRSDDIGAALGNRQLPIAHFTSHDLRRTVVSQLDELGIALDTIAAVVGHQRGTKATRTLVRHYARARLDERVEAALTAWNSRLAEITSGHEAAGNVVAIRSAS